MAALTLGRAKNNTSGRRKAARDPSRKFDPIVVNLPPAETQSSIMCFTCSVAGSFAHAASTVHQLLFRHSKSPGRKVYRTTIRIDILKVTITGIRLTVMLQRSFGLRVPDSRGCGCGAGLDIHGPSLFCHSACTHTGHYAAFSLAM